jgi:hypothetical protein
MVRGPADAGNGAGGREVDGEGLTMKRSIFYLKSDNIVIDKKR